MYTHVFANDLFDDFPGWIYISVNTLCSYSIQVTMDKFTIEDAKFLAVPTVYSFHEAVLHVTMQINPAQFNQKTLGVVAFS